VLACAGAATAVGALAVTAASAATKVTVVSSAPATVTVGSPLSIGPIAPGYDGLSMEYTTVAAYEGTGPTGADPVLGPLIRALSPGQAPVLRIGGDSTDWTWWPVPGMKAPAGIRNSLSPTWIAKAQALEAGTGARLILGINLEADSTTLAAVEAQQLVDGIGAQHVAALEIGNEPQLYSQLPWYSQPKGVPHFGRPAGYDLADYQREFIKFSNVMPKLPLAGPSVGHSWITQIAPYLRSESRVGLVTFHFYGADDLGQAFRGMNCGADPAAESYPTLAKLLNPSATAAVMNTVAPMVAIAHRRGLKFRIDETNAVTCAGEPDVSNTFASALWALESLFEMAQVGVDGVNIHTWRGSEGRVFDLTQTGGQWAATVAPEYYGMLMFARAVPSGSRLLATTQSSTGPVVSWAVRAPDHSTRVVLVNDSLVQSGSTLVRGPAGAGAASLQRLLAPSAGATGGVTLAGQSFGISTSTGQLTGPLQVTTLKPRGGAYAVSLPAASAVLLTIPARR
jgi:hypothetical protein